MNAPTAPVGAPQKWLDGLARHLRDALAGAPVEGAVSGPGWLSVRVGGGFLWLFAHGADRMVWLADEPLPGAWLRLLGRHARSPFPAHLRARRIDTLHVLENPGGAADGLRIDLGPTPLHRLQARFFPRPGAIWIASDGGDDLARQGRMEGDPLEPRDPGDAPDFDPAEHGRRCEAALRERLRRQTARTLRQRVEQTRKRAQRRVWQLEGDLREARADQDVRAKADLLAAHLHAIEPGREHVELVDFEGRPVTIELDPARSPAANLDRWYKRAGRAERKVEQVGVRLEESRTALATAEDLHARLETFDDETPLETWLDFAEAHDLDPAPRTPKPASERGRPDADRLPYWSFVLDGWELRVGRSGKDNDLLLKSHAHGRDLWLHAQGVPGSHVVLRTGGKEVPRGVIEATARVAAHYSRAKTSATVPVLVTERRHVRKPRKAAPGEVVPDRAKTVFVEPGIPSRCRRADGSGDEE